MDPSSTVEAVAKRVLIVVGGAHFAEQIERALVHPQIEPQTAHNEGTIVTALTGGQWDLAIVGGLVGRRGPLVLCDAVRLRQPELPVLVLVDEDTDSERLAEHQARGMADVTYVNLRGTRAQKSRLASARMFTLEALSSEEDAETAELWPSLVGELEQPPIAAPEPDADTETPAGASDVPPPVPARKQAETDDALPETRADFVEAVTDEDLEFAATMVRHARSVDFRAPPQKLKQTAGVDATTLKLRGKVRELERNLARLGHVFGHRTRELESATAEVDSTRAKSTDIELERDALRADLTAERQAWSAERGELEGRIQAQAQRLEAAETDLQTRRAEVASVQDETKKTAESFTGALKETQESVAALREQSQTTIDKLEKQIEGLETQLARESDTAVRLTADLDETRQQLKYAEAGQREAEEETRRQVEQLKDERATIEEARADRIAALKEEQAARVSELTEQNASRVSELKEEHAGKVAQLQDVHATDLRELEIRYSEASRERSVESERAAAERGEVTVHATRLQAELDNERERLGTMQVRIQELEQKVETAKLNEAHLADQHASALQAARDEWSEREQELLGKADQLKDAAATFRGVQRDQEKTSATLDKELAVLRERATTSETQLSELKQEHKEVAKALERERNRPMGAVLEGRLAAVEEFARNASESVTRQNDSLSSLDERAARQEALAEQLLSALSEQPGGDAIVRAASVAQSSGRSSLSSASAPLLNWLNASPARFAAVIGGLLLLTIVVTWLAARPGSTPAIPAPTVVPTAAAAAADADADADAAMEPSLDDALAAAGDSEPEPEPEPESEPEPEPSPEPAAEPVADDEPDAAAAAPPDKARSAKAAPKKPKSEQERKALRRTLMEAAGRGRWAVAAPAGNALRSRYSLDWEAHIQYADALRRTNDTVAAITEYRRFIKAYPTNKFVDEALLRVANLLLKLERKKEAIVVYKKIAADPKNKNRGKANLALKALGAK